MGLIKAFAGSAISYIGDLWEDYIYCDSLDSDTLVQKGHARRSPGAGKSGSDNIITEGSRIAVNDGQMLIVVENGRIIDFSAEPGGYEYKSNTEPSAFCGKFGDAMRLSFGEMKKRFAYGGQAANDQRVYFVNTKEIMNNKFGFGNVPYRDAEFNMTILMQGFGTYTFELVDPIVFYTNVCGNVEEKFDKSEILSQMKTEIQNALLPVMGELAKKGVHYDEIALQTETILRLLQNQLCEQWKNDRGIEIKTMAFGNILPDDESVDKIRQLQESRAYAGNRAMLGARVGAAQANAMESAAENTSGAVNGFMGMGMAQNTGGVNVTELMREEPVKKPEAQNEAVWTCECGMVNTTKFCPNCGGKKPENAVCSGCGYEIPIQFANMKFCPNCGKER